MDLIAYHYNQASLEASKEVERIARKILRKCKTFDEFIMAMGGCFFVDKNDNRIDNDDPRVKELYNLIYEWDDCLKITGEPMRFTTYGEKVTNW